VAIVASSQQATAALSVQVAGGSERRTSEKHNLAGSEKQNLALSLLNQ
jgi:hypothetical protein